MSTGVHENQLLQTIKLLQVTSCIDLMLIVKVERSNKDLVLSQVTQIQDSHHPPKSLYKEEAETQQIGKALPHLLDLLEPSFPPSLTSMQNTY